MMNIPQSTFLPLWVAFFLLSPLFAQQEETIGKLQARIVALEKELLQEKQKNLKLTQQADFFKDISKYLQQITFGPEMFLEQAETIVEITKVRYQTKTASAFENALAQTFLEKLKLLQGERNTTNYQKAYDRLFRLAEKRYKRKKSELKKFFEVFGLKKISSKKIAVPKEWLEGDSERREELGSLQFAKQTPALKLSHWNNSSALDLAQLQGKVVLLNFWAPW